MAWRRPGGKPLSEPMMVSLLTHKCVIRPQWANTYICTNELRIFQCTNKLATRYTHWNHQSHTSMAQCKTAVSPVCEQWRYYSLALSHCHIRFPSWILIPPSDFKSSAADHCRHYRNTSTLYWFTYNLHIGDIREEDSDPTTGCAQVIHTPLFESNEHLVCNIGRCHL